VRNSEQVYFDGGRCRRLLGVLAFPVLVVEVEFDGDAAREAAAVVAAAATARNTLMASSGL